jgi:hypothetical protein
MTSTNGSGTDWVVGVIVLLAEIEDCIVGVTVAEPGLSPAERFPLTRVNTKLL